MNCYAAYYQNPIREQSSSGGVFSVLASQFDIVYGVAMTQDCYGCEFVRVDTDISPLRGSKYLQARVGDTYKLVKEDLQNGLKVLFSGTGCQINGLFHYLQKEYENLFLLDVVCHGVPSPKLWREYVLFQESKIGKIESVSFRCKDDSWKNFGMKENQLYSSKDVDPYMRMFLRNRCLRPSCYACHAKKYKKSDMTIADFWGINKVAPEMNDKRGTSLVIIRTEKGEELFQTVKGDLHWKSVSYEEGIRHNIAEYKSVHRPSARDSFYQDLLQLPFSEMVTKYAETIPRYRKILGKLKRFLLRIVKKGR